MKSNLTFLELYQSIFQPLEYAMLDGDPASQVALLSFYTSLLRQWTATLLSDTPPLNAGSSISALTTHANLLALTLLQTSPGVQTHGQILTFYETTASLISHPSLQSHIRITTPPSTLIYTLHFSSSLSTLSRLCAILALYKRAFESAMSKPVPTPSQGIESQTPGPHIEPYPKDYVNHFNGFLMDICNCIWRSRAFNTSDLNALGCLLPPPLLPLLTSYIAGLETGLSLSTLFTLSYSPVLCNLSITHFRDLEDKEIETEGRGEDGESGGQGIRTRHAGPVTARSLEKLGKEGGLRLTWPTYRLGVLGFLERKGVNGVGELMYKSIKNLMGRER
jgi:centromere protein I